MVAHRYKHTVTDKHKAYLDYYKAQAGGEIPKFHGTEVQYGYGLGGLLRSLICRIIPIGSRVLNAIKPVAKQAFEIAKPHLKEAAKDLTKEAIRRVTEKLGESSEPQTGFGRKKIGGKAATNRMKALKKVKAAKGVTKKRSAVDQWPPKRAKSGQDIF